jgi:hypothetical protein
MQAKEEIPEAELIDVDVVVFGSVELTEEEAREQGTHPSIRESERHFIPYHLKNALQQSSYWGAVRVVPAVPNWADLMVRGEVLESNGEHLILRVEIVDASGDIWFEKAYEAEATEFSYTDNTVGQKDAFQDLYNTIANDMTDFREQLSPIDIQTLRNISKMKFAADFVPDAFGDYLTEDEDGKFTINRLPADDDPMVERLTRIRERDHMYVDTLNEYYDEFYNEMWPAYENWRSANQIEQSALRKIKRDAITRQVAGILLTAMALGLGFTGVEGLAVLQGAMVLVGGAVFIDGINISKEAEIHRMAIDELSESFGGEMKPVVMEFEGEEYELTGSAEEQYRQWRELLREIYYEETGLGPADDQEIEAPADG